MTATERQQRRRLKLRREKARAAREAETLAKRAKNAARLAEHYQREREARQAALEYVATHPPSEEVLARFQQPLPNAADELARQIDDFIAEDGTITIDDVRTAIDRRFGTRAP